MGNSKKKGDSKRLFADLKDRRDRKEMVIKLCDINEGVGGCARTVVGQPSFIIIERWMPLEIENQCLSRSCG